MSYTQFKTPFMELYEELSILNEAKSAIGTKKDEILNAYLMSDNKAEFIAGLQNSINIDAAHTKRLQYSIKLLEKSNSRIFPVIINKELGTSSTGWMPLDSVRSESEELKRASGCYIIRNKLTGQVYIGKASHFEDRMTPHAKGTDGDSTALHKAVKKLGSSNFEWGILTLEDDGDKRNELESIYIGNSDFREANSYNTLYNIFDYNLVPGGKGGGKSKFDLKTKLEIFWTLYSTKALNIKAIAKEYESDHKTISSINDKSYDWVKSLIRNLKHTEVITILQAIIDDKNKLEQFITDITNNKTIHPVSDKDTIEQNSKTVKADEDVYMKLLRGWVADNKFMTSEGTTDNPLGDELLSKVNKLFGRADNAPYFMTTKQNRHSEIFITEPTAQLMYSRLNRYLKNADGTNGALATHNDDLNINTIIELFKKYYKYNQQYPQTVDDFRKSSLAAKLMQEFLSSANILTNARGKIMPATQCSDLAEPKASQISKELSSIIGKQIDLQIQLKNAKEAERTANWGQLTIKGTTGGGKGYSRDPDVLYNFNTKLAELFQAALDQLNLDSLKEPV